MKLRLGVLLIGAVVLSACDSGTLMGARSLGRDFFRMFSMDRNAEPIDAQAVALTLTPRIEPFNP